jgi:hypothetical protein
MLYSRLCLKKPKERKKEGRKKERKKEPLIIRDSDSLHMERTTKISLLWSRPPGLHHLYLISAVHFGALDEHII